MTEIGDGWYRYDYSAYNADIDYVALCDGSATLKGYDRYVVGSNADDLEISGKIPTNFFMGSSDGSDKDDEIDAIKLETDKIQTIDDNVDQLLLDVASA